MDDLRSTLARELYVATLQAIIEDVESETFPRRIGIYVESVDNRIAGAFSDAGLHLQELCVSDIEREEILQGGVAGVPTPPAGVKL